MITAEPGKYFLCGSSITKLPLFQTTLDALCSFRLLQAFFQHQPLTLCIRYDKLRLAMDRLNNWIFRLPHLRIKIIDLAKVICVIWCARISLVYLAE